ncbi:MAG TPA: DUF6583 family protein [Virgibacillus sp.]|nr:DUF6583 family protein [Virgibacillus sp.]
MNETPVHGNGHPPAKGKSKKITLILIILLVIAGGSAAAYVLLQPSDKEKYFLAEKGTIDFIKDAFEERYAPETKWKDQKKEKPINTETEFAVEYNDPYGGNYGLVDMINNATLTFETTTDIKEKKFASELSAQFAGMEFDDFHYYLTEDRMMAGLPFTDDILQIKSDDLPSLLHELDPESYTGDEDINFGDFFDGFDAITQNLDTDHFKDEYVNMIYEALPEDAFAVSKDKINVQNNNIKTKKITLHLSEKELKSILNKTIDTMKHDDVLKEMIRDQFSLNVVSSASEIDPAFEDNLDELLDAFEDGLDELQSGISDLEIPGGLTSTIWEKDDLIVKRNFSLSIGPSKNEVVEFSVDGEQLLNKDKQMVDYTLSADDESLNLKGDLSSTDDNIKDSIKIENDLDKMTYESDETLKDGTREYERVIAVDSHIGGSSSFIWNGEATYDNDNMTSENTFALETPDLSQDMFQLHVSKDSKTVKNVDIPDDNIKDLGGMDIMELNRYFEMELAPQAEQWIQEYMGGGLMNGGF